MFGGLEENARLELNSIGFFSPPGGTLSCVSDLKLKGPQAWKNIYGSVKHYLISNGIAVPQWSRVYWLLFKSLAIQHSHRCWMGNAPFKSYFFSQCWWKRIWSTSWHRYIMHTRNESYFHEIIKSRFRQGVDIA